MTVQDLNLDDFLTQNNIPRDSWLQANIEFNELKEIAIDYSGRVDSFRDTSEYLAKMLQGCPEVHSVRWRVKDPHHLMEKIVRKRAAKEKKYIDISKDNYLKKVTDLVGIRVLHLFKYEWELIQNFIRSKWFLVEKKPIAYIRAGDHPELKKQYEKSGCRVKNHPSGYRSVHYIISTQPTSDKIIAEIQVRTIFEEGWSEIDHRIRYPNFSDNELISYFLTIFNRMAGSADEMGSFVNNLALQISNDTKSEGDRLRKIEELIEELQNEKDKNAAMDDKLNQLHGEVAKLSKRNASGFSFTQINQPSRIGSIMERIESFRSLESYLPARSASGSALSFSPVIRQGFKTATPANKDPDSNKND